MGVGVPGGGTTPDGGVASSPTTVTTNAVDTTAVQPEENNGLGELTPELTPELRTPPGQPEGRGGISKERDGNRGVRVTLSERRKGYRERYIRGGRRNGVGGDWLWYVVAV